LPIPPKTVVPEFMNAFTNNTAGFECVLRNLPILPVNIVPVSASFGFVVNYNALVTGNKIPLDKYGSVITISCGNITNNQNDSSVEQNNRQDKAVYDKHPLDDKAKIAVEAKTQTETNVIIGTTGPVIGVITAPQTMPTP
jgi:hypothetical protein